MLFYTLLIVGSTLDSCVLPTDQLTDSKAVSRLDSGVLSTDPKVVSRLDSGVLLTVSKAVLWLHFGVLFTIQLCQG